MTLSALFALGWLGLAPASQDLNLPPAALPVPNLAQAPAAPVSPPAVKPEGAPIPPPAGAAAAPVPPPAVSTEGAPVPPPAGAAAAPVPPPAVSTEGAPVPPPAGAAPAPVPYPAPAEGAVPPPPPATGGEPAAGAKAPTFTFTLGGKSESTIPGKHGDAKGDGKIEVEAGDNQVKAVLGAATGANVFLGTESVGIETVQLTQEFEITCSDASINQVHLTLESSLLGFIRSKHKASAGLKLASATIAPVGWTGSPLAISYPTACIGGPTGCNGPRGYKFETPVDPVKSPAMPLGRYVLQANLVVTASASGLLDGHATAIFMAESEDLDAWEREHDPFKGDAHDDFGFTLTLKADAPPGYPAVSHRKMPKRVSARPKARHMH